MVDFSQVVKEPVLDFENVVGQDSITRLDHTRSKNKKKKKKKKVGGEGGPIAENAAMRPRESAQNDSPRPIQQQNQSRRPAPNAPRHAPSQDRTQKPNAPKTPSQDSANVLPPRQTPGINPRQAPSVPPKPEPIVVPKPNVVPQAAPAPAVSKPNIVPRTSPSNRPARTSPKKDNNENP